MDEYMVTVWVLASGVYDLDDRIMKVDEHTY